LPVSLPSVCARLMPQNGRGLSHGLGSDALSRESCPLCSARHVRPRAPVCASANRPLGNRLCQLSVDEAVIEADLGGVGGEVSERNASQARPVDCPQTHRAGFTRAVQFVVFELENAESGTGFADPNYHGVRRGIGSGRIDALRPSITPGTKPSGYGLAAGTRRFLQGRTGSLCLFFRSRRCCTGDRSLDSISFVAQAGTVRQ